MHNKRKKRKNKALRPLVGALLAFCVPLASLAGCSDSADDEPPEAGNPPGADDSLFIFDMSAFLDTLPSYSASYDYLKLATALQGLANREKPRIYFMFESTRENRAYGTKIDAYWLEKLSADGKLFGSLTKNSEKYPPTLNGFHALMEDFSRYFEGFVVWDEDVPATSNLASTAAGAYDLLPVRYSGEPGSLYRSLFSPEGANHKTSEIKLDFTGKFNSAAGNIWDTAIPSTGSAKCDAYLWAKEKLLDANLTNPLRMAYCTDAWIGGAGTGSRQAPLFETTLANADFHIAQKSFFFDLSVDDSIAPIDDRGQRIGEDVRTLRELLLSQAKRSGFNIFSLSGFVPWNYKYTSVADPESHMEPVIAEWTSIAIFSAYGAQSEADANAGIGDVSNLSALCHETLDAELRQSNDRGASNALEYDKDTKYLMIYMGDYDAASWSSSILPMFWDDPRRGEMPLCWPVCSGLSKRIPHLYNYIYETAGPGDYFVAGNNGTGYIVSTMFEPEQRPEGMEDLMPAWEKLNIEYNRRFDLDILGFHINLDSRTLCVDYIPTRVMESFAKIWPKGAVVMKGLSAVGFGNAEYAKNPETGELTPCIGHWDIYRNYASSPEEYGQAIYDLVSFPGLRNRQFHMVRTIMASPSLICDSVAHMREAYPDLKFEVVDPYTMMRLVMESG